MVSIVNSELCYKCLGAIPSGFYHRDNLGWSCQFCAQEMVPCRASSLGCHFIDFPSKTMKHEFFFCCLTPRCGVCKQKIPCSLLDHFRSVNDHTIYKAGEKFRANNNAETHLMLADCGPVVVDYKLTKELFAVNIMASISSNLLHKFTCAVQVFDPVKGTEFVNIVKEQYTDLRDWYFAMNPNSFPQWSGFIDVAVDVNSNNR